MLTLNIIGAGHVGQTLGKLWHDSGQVTIGYICNQSLESAKTACEFIGGGSPVDLNGFVKELEREMGKNSQCVMLSVPDSQLPSLVKTLAAKFQIHTDECLFFHTSGILTSNVLHELGGHCASVHPIHSFSEIQNSLQTFAGTYCGYECSSSTHAETVELCIHKLFSGIGAKLLKINPDQKHLYHAGAVFACNYLSTLMDLSLQCYQLAGIERSDSLKLISPIVTQTLANIFEKGPLAALSGNIAREDIELVKQQYLAIRAQDVELAKAYAQFGKSTIQMIQAQSKNSSTKLSQLLDFLS